jgi:hypothetical protein
MFWHFSTFAMKTCKFFAEVASTPVCLSMRSTWGIVEPLVCKISNAQFCYNLSVHSDFSYNGTTVSDTWHANPVHFFTHLERNFLQICGRDQWNTNCSLFPCADVCCSVINTVKQGMRTSRTQVTEFDRNLLKCCQVIRCHNVNIAFVWLPREHWGL